MKKNAMEARMIELHVDASIYGITKDAHATED